MIQSQMLAIALIGIVAFGCQWLAWRVRLPAILFLLAAGIAVGPVTGVLNPDAIFEELLFPLISLAVAIILFEGSLTLTFNEIRSQKKVVQRLILQGALITWVAVAVVTHYLFALGWELSVLFGALCVVTGPTVIVPILRTVRPNAAVGNILRWEGILIDPIGALLVVVVYEFIVAHGEGSGFYNSLLAFAKIIGIGSLFGIAGGAALSQILRRHWVPDFLQNLATLSILFAVFTWSDALAHESGLLAVTLMGMWLANQKDLHIADILNFKEHLTIVLISGLFIILAARLTLSDLFALGWTPLILLLVMQFAIRPLAVWFSALGSSLNWREKSLLAWIAPRGIVAAAVSSLFAIKLTDRGVEQSELLVPLTFIVIIGTVVLQSATAGPVAKLLGVAAPRPRGFLILGANSVARAIAQAMGKHDIRILLADTNWDHIKAARMEGLETFYGNPVSEYADQRLDLVGIGKLLAMSTDRNNNTVAGMHFRAEFGARNIYTLQTSVDAKTPEKHQPTSGQRGYVLFGRELTYGKLASVLARGGEIRSTKLTEEFSYEDFLKTHGENTCPLFAVGPEGRIQIFVDQGDFTPDAGWTLVSLIIAPEEESKKQKAQ